MTPHQNNLKISCLLYWFGRRGGIVAVYASKDHKTLSSSKSSTSYSSSSQASTGPIPITCPRNIVTICWKSPSVIIAPDSFSEVTEG
ncbi:hypothetical protein P8452_65223 [Trifolium repens]|nr:hypothetical protein P8452_65223 [Trifolium repens]